MQSLCSENLSSNNLTDFFCRNKVIGMLEIHTILVGFLIHYIVKFLYIEIVVKIYTENIYKIRYVKYF